MVTAPNRKVARALAEAALSAKLAACVNLLPGLESHYWWQGKIESSREMLLLLKTSRGCLARLRKLVCQKHPYKNPEFIALAIDDGTPAYLRWISSSIDPG